MNLQELNILVRLLLVWAAVLTVALAFAAIRMADLEERIRQKIAEDMKKALGVERLLGE